MQADPMLEWRRLIEHYREMSDGELRELAVDFANLTDTAQQVLRSEMKSRGLGEPQAAKRTPEVWSTADAFRSPASNAPENFDSILASAAVALGPRAPEIVPDSPDTDDEDAGPHEYTWKTILCACDSREEARQIQEVLRRSGIESWVELQGSKFPDVWDQAGIGNLQVLVAADQLDRARAIAANPIPQEIVDESRMEAPEFEPPVCPKCGASDPVLVGVDPENTWQCEQCDTQWTESAGSEDEEAPKAG